MVQAGARTRLGGTPGAAPPRTPLSVPRLHPQAAAAARKGASPAEDPAAPRDPPVDATSQRVAALLLNGRRSCAEKGSRSGPGSRAAAGDENADMNCRADVILPSPDRPPAAKSVWNIGPAGSPGAPLAKPCRSRNPALAPRAAAPGGSRLGRKRKVEVGDAGAAAGGAPAVG